MANGFPMLRIPTDRWRRHDDSPGPGDQVGEKGDRIRH